MFQCYFHHLIFISTRAFVIKNIIPAQSGYNLNLKFSQFFHQTLYSIFFSVHCSSWNCTSKNSCPKIIQVAWWNVAPYIYLDSSNNHIGIFSEVIEKVVAQCCGTCSSLQYRKGDSDSEDLKKRIGEFRDQFFTCF